MAIVNFLSIDDNNEEIKNLLLRKQAKNILESYNQDWDILSEIFQNSIDAIDQNDAIDKGIIKFTFNKNTHQISIWDNGIGINSNELSQILRPSVTYKEGRNNLRGEKGVGLSFLLFSTNDLVIESCKQGEKVVGKVSNAFDWVINKTEDIPQLDLSVKQCNDDFSHTKFTLSEVHSIQEELDIFSYSLGRLKHIIRTRTAVGNTGNIFGCAPHKDIEIELKYVDENGDEFTEKIPYSFDCPQNYIKPNLSFTERQKRLANKEDRFVTGKAIFNSGTFITNSGKAIKYYYFVAGRTKFVDMSKQILITEEDRDLVRGGIYLSTKSMPTGVMVSPPSVGKEGYWANLYIVFEYDDLKLDMGRKSVPPRTAQMMKSLSENIYNEVKNHFIDILDTDNEIEDELQSTEIIDNMWDFLQDEVKNLNIDYLTYFKEPQTEQGVIAIFYELIGREKLNGYQTWRISSKDTYDAFVKYRKDEKSSYRKIILEFKNEGSDVIEDFLSYKKEYTKIKLLVCWSINESKFAQKGFSIRAFEDDDGRYFNGATHEIRMPNVGSPIEVICLKKFLSK